MLWFLLVPVILDVTGTSGEFDSRKDGRAKLRNHSVGVVRSVTTRFHPPLLAQMCRLQNQTASASPVMNVGSDTSTRSTITGPSPTIDRS